MNRTLTAVTYIIIVSVLSCVSRATTYMECASKDIKTCAKEVTKGDVVTGLATKNGKKYIKIDYVKFDTEKGTIKNDKD